MMNRYQITYWSITWVSAALHTTTSKLHVGEEDRSEQGSSPPISPSGNVSAGNMYLVVNEDM